LATALAAGLSLGTSGASATALGFEGLPDFDVPAGLYVESGYNLSIAGTMFSELDNGTLGAREVEGLCCASGGVLTITQAGGGNFQFASVDMELEYGGPLALLTLQGYLDGVLQATDVLNTVGFLSYSTTFAILLAGVTIDELRITAQRDFDAGMSFDSLVLNSVAAVPIPSSLALLGLGLGALVGARRKAAA